jgi:hypothetical protein
VNAALFFVAFQGVWFASVAGAARGHAWVGPGAAALLVAGVLARSDERGRVAVRIAAVGLAGALADSLLLALGATAYATVPRLWPAALVPPWIIGLWVAFAATAGPTLGWARGRPVLAALVGAVGGPASYAAGARLGAVTMPDPALTSLALALEYALAVPLLAGLVPAEGDGAHSSQGTG